MTSAPAEHSEVFSGIADTAVFCDNPWEMLPELEGLEGFVLSVVCLHVECDFVGLDIPTLRHLLARHGLRPAELLALGERPMESLNAHEDSDLECHPINALLTSAVLRHAGNLPDGTEREAWLVWMAEQLAALRDKTPFRLLSALPEGLALHPDAAQLKSILRTLHKEVGGEEVPSLEVVLGNLEAQLGTIPEALFPQATPNRAKLPAPPSKSRVISVARPVIPPPEHRELVRRVAALAIFDMSVSALPELPAPTPVIILAASEAAPKPRPLERLMLFHPSSSLTDQDGAKVFEAKPLALPAEPEPAPEPTSLEVLAEKLVQFPAVVPEESVDLAETSEVASALDLADYPEESVRPHVYRRYTLAPKEEPVLSLKAAGVLSGLVGVGLGCWVVLEGVLVGNAVWIGLGLALMVSLLGLDYLLTYHAAWITDPEGIGAQAPQQPALPVRSVVVAASGDPSELPSHV